jgi:hypothetical protein
MNRRLNGGSTGFSCSDGNRAEPWPGVTSQELDRTPPSRSPSPMRTPTIGWPCQALPSSRFFTRPHSNRWHSPVRDLKPLSTPARGLPAPVVVTATDAPASGHLAKARSCRLCIKHWLALADGLSQPRAGFWPVPVAAACPVRSAETAPLSVRPWLRRPGCVALPSSP